MKQLNLKTYMEIIFITAIMFATTTSILFGLRVWITSFISVIGLGGIIVSIGIINMILEKVKGKV